MFKMFTTLVRAAGHEACEAVTDANALVILRQQLRDATEGVTRARKSVAVVMAYAARDRQEAERLAARIADLELRTVAALDKGREDLALEAAQAIAGLEAEKATLAASIAQYDREIMRLREQLALSEQRLKALQRGRQIAEAASRTQALRGTMPDGVVSSLHEAEATLERLQARQAHGEAVETAMGELSGAGTSASLDTRLAAAGCGPAATPAAEAILARLRGC